MHRCFIHLSVCAMLLASLPVRAFGVGDLLGSAISAGTKVGGALVDKAIDSAKDPEAEKKKRDDEKEQQQSEMKKGFKEALDEIEARPGLTPYQREKMKLSLIEMVAQLSGLAKFAEEMQDRQEAQRKAERDRLLTFGGIAGTVGQAALNSPSSLMARTNQLSKSDDFNKQMRGAMAQADSRNGNGAAIMKSAVGNAAKAGQAQENADGAMANAQKQVNEQLQPIVEKIAEEANETREKLSAIAATTTPTASQDSFFSQDFNKQIFIEYVDNDVETAKLRELLVAQGYKLANSRAAADVYFRVEGEFLIPETTNFQGVAVSAGKALGQPETIKAPEKKSQGLLQSAIGGALTGLLQPQKATKEPPLVIYGQNALIVASRQAGSDREVRLSAQNGAKSAMLEVTNLVKSANQDLYAKLGLITKPAPAEDVASVDEMAHGTQSTKLRTVTDPLKLQYISNKDWEPLVFRPNPSLPEINETPMGSKVRFFPRLKVIPCPIDCQGSDYEDAIKKLVAKYDAGLSDGGTFEYRGELPIKIRWFHARSFLEKMNPLSSDEIGYSFILEGKLISLGERSISGKRTTASDLAEISGKRLAASMVLSVGMGAKPRYLTYKIEDTKGSLLEATDNALGGARKIEAAFGREDIRLRLEPVTEANMDLLPAMDGVEPGEVNPIKEVVFPLYWI